MREAADVLHVTTRTIAFHKYTMMDIWSENEFRSIPLCYKGGSDCRFLNSWHGPAFREGILRCSSESRLRRFRRRGVTPPIPHENDYAKPIKSIARFPRGAIFIPRGAPTAHEVSRETVPALSESGPPNQMREDPRGSSGPEPETQSAVIRYSEPTSKLPCGKNTSHLFSRSL